MKHKMTVLTVIFVLLVLGAASTVFITSNTHVNADCTNATNVKTHTIMIMDDTVDPVHTTGKRCDILTITNMDSETRLIAFGPHEKHVAYDGVADKILHKNESVTITMVKTGNYRFHDHEHDEVQGYFKVTQ